MRQLTAKSEIIFFFDERKMVTKANSFNYYSKARKCIFIGRQIVYKNVKYSFIENSSKQKKAQYTII